MPRILVVDDNADLRRITARVLEEFGRYEVVTAAGGIEALEILEREATHRVPSNELAGAIAPGIASGDNWLPVLEATQICGELVRGGAQQMESTNV